MLLYLGSMNHKPIEQKPIQDQEGLKQCFKKPTEFIGFGPTINTIVCFDENGSSQALDYVKRQLVLGRTIDEGRRYFTLTGCIFKKSEYDNAKYLITKLKKQYWKEKWQSVVLHTREIKKGEGNFNFPKKRQDQFMASLSNTLSMVSCTIVSISFDLELYAREGYLYDPYEVAFDYLLKDIYGLTQVHEKVALVFESRGELEDHQLLAHVSKVFYSSGTKELAKEKIRDRIRGVFFNSKHSKIDPNNVYPGIEVADLFSYPIHRYVKYGRKGKDFESIETRIAYYPKYMGKGIRKFPKGWFAATEKTK